MTQLNCSVKTCTHYSDNYCCKGRIVVEGQAAQAVDQTSCGSFEERSRDTFSNRFETPQTNMEVECEAGTCEYNQDRYCNANSIGITGSAACQPAETSCASFSVRG